MNRIFWKGIVVIAFLSGCTSATRHEDIISGWQEMNRILGEIQISAFPENTFFITDYGAESNGKICTDAIRDAIIECHESGGGKDIVPNGTYLTGAIHLLSNVNLHLKEAAVIQFSTDPEDYLPVVVTRQEGLELYNYSPLVYAYQRR